MTELGAVLNSTGRASDALPVLEDALRIRRIDYPEDHVMVAATRTELADSLNRLGRGDEALPMLEQSLSVLENTTGRRLQRVRSAYARLQEGAD